jgi:S-(hydroxymethyl)glutathione dehydrogenase/alcohol dehydrogenase
MKAAILTELKKPLIIGDLTIPDLTFGQVLVRIVSTGICGSQLGEIDGKKGQDRYLPHLLGHEASGIVEKTGPYVTKVKEGDHVILHWRQGSGIQSPTPKYGWGDRIVNAGWVTTFQEKAVVSENRMTVIPRDSDMEIAALYGCAVTTGFGSIINDARLSIGKSVIIFGAGAVGLCAVQGAKLVSAYPIIAIDILDTKLKMAQQSGATHTINSSDASYLNILASIIGPSGADAVIETTGIGPVIERAYQLTSASGTTVLVGVPSHDTVTQIDTMPLHFDKKITGSHGGSTIPDVDIPRYLRAQNAGYFDLKHMITHRYTLDTINDAIDMTRSGKAGRCIINFN